MRHTGNLGTRNVKVFSLVHFYFETGKVCKSHAHHPTLIGREFFFFRLRSSVWKIRHSRSVNVLIKAITKFSNAFGHYQPDWSTNMTVNALCLWLDSIVGQSKGQLTRHARVIRQNESCVCAVASHFAELTVVVFFFYENVQPMSSFFLKFCHSFD